MSLWQATGREFIGPLTTDLSERETGQGVQHVGKAISQPTIRLRLNGKLKR
ncbi:hypothetical protein [Phocaeicola coprocola]|jgi:hypothetical protein|uniref:hypothetical protein n=1 Tax=Phocaeicola coprocola TaxID=310298 RepID=UPI0015F330C7|nr:hypothetical protein [Phocaeicola coprocola]